MPHSQIIVVTPSVKAMSQVQIPLPISPRIAFRNIRNFLAGRFVGATRDKALLDEMLKCLFAKHWLIKTPALAVAQDISKSYRAAFAHVKQTLPGVFEASDELELDPAAIAFVDEQLDAINLEESRADVFSDLYETFAGSGTKSNEGQFFTPVSAVNLLVDMVGPKPGQSVCDPACGAGGFLIAAAKRMIADGASTQATARNLSGVDKDEYLARITLGRLALFLDHLSDIECADSLSGITQDRRRLPDKLFDVVLTNPPFGSRIVAAEPDTMSRYVLAKKWARESDNSTYTPNGSINLSTPPQVLFLEHCLNILKPEGVLGAILPESMVSAKSYEFVVQHIRDQAQVVAVVGMPEALFKTSGKGGTHTKTVAIVLKKNPAPARRYIFFAEAKWCGHDSRGRSVPLNDLPTIEINFQRFLRGESVREGYLGMKVAAKSVKLNLAPRAFEHDIEAETDRLDETHTTPTLGELVKKKVLAVSTGDEVGKLAYGTGDIPFIRTSDLSNWELKLDPKHSVSEEVHSRLASKQDVQPGDILMVKDGTYLIGTCAIVTKYDLPMLYQSHLYKIRVLDSEMLTPYLLLAALNSEYVQQQVKSFCVSQDIIDSLGSKIYDLRIPVPKSKQTRTRIAEMVERLINDRIEARELARRASREITETQPFT